MTILPLVILLAQTSTASDRDDNLYMRSAAASAVLSTCVTVDPARASEYQKALDSWLNKNAKGIKAAEKSADLELASSLGDMLKERVRGASAENQRTICQKHVDILRNDW